VRTLLESPACLVQYRFERKDGMLESMETPEHERREIEEYVRSQSGPDLEIEHMEKLASEYILGTQYDVWDAHTNEGRWWVITNPTNLYSQQQIKSMDGGVVVPYWLVGKSAGP
jgi:hypothetical protein